MIKRLNLVQTEPPELLNAGEKTLLLSAVFATFVGFPVAALQAQ